MDDAAGYYSDKKNVSLTGIFSIGGTLVPTKLDVLRSRFFSDISDHNNRPKDGAYIAQQYCVITLKWCTGLRAKQLYLYFILDIFY